MLDWNDLQFALAVGRHGSLNRAARALGVHQTTVGRRIDALEQALAVPLFLRTPRGLVPAPEGARLLSSIEGLAGSLARFEASLGDEQDAMRGLVRVAVTENTARLLVSHTLPVLRARHPELMIELQPANAAVELGRGEADLAVRVVRSEEPDVVARRVGVVRYGLYGSAAYLRAHGDQPEDLAGHAVLVPSRELSRGPEASWLARYGRAAQVAIHASSLVTLAVAAEHGMGLTVLPTNLAALHPRLQLVRRLPEIPERPVWVVIHKDVRRLKRVRVVAAAVTEGLEDILRRA
jgi:DNA-binding transcriptional LysR family regulator